MWVQVPSLDADYGMDAAHFLSQATGGGKRMTASIERRERRQQARGRDPLGSQPLLHVVLSMEGKSAAADSVNADMLRAGLARVKAGKTQQVAKPVPHLDSLYFGCLPLTSYCVCQMCCAMILLQRSGRSTSWILRIAQLQHDCE